MQDRTDAGKKDEEEDKEQDGCMCMAGQMLDRTDAGQDRGMPDADARQEICSTGRLLEWTDAGQDGCRKGQIQYRADTRQVRCRTGIYCTLQEYTDAGQERYRTYSWPKDHKQTGRMQYRSATEEDEFRTGQMQNR